MATAQVTRNTAKAARQRINSTKKRLGHHFQKVNYSQPSQILKYKQKQKLVPVIAELKRQATSRKEFENFIKRAKQYSNRTHKLRR